MGVFIDTIIYCDVCLAEGGKACSVWASRQIVKKIGWKSGKGFDVCDDCMEGARADGFSDKEYFENLKEANP